MWFKSDVMSVVESALKKRSWKYARTGEDSLLTGVGSPAGSVLMSIHNEEARKTLLFLMNPTTGEPSMHAVMAGVPPYLRIHAKAGHSGAQVAQVCELIADFNYDLLLGSVERDASDGQVRLRVTLPYRDASVTVEQVSWCIDVGAATLFTALGKIQEVLGATSAQPIMEI
jgi:hypothetical protein